MLTANEIRCKYPTPVPGCHGQASDAYCVGGALILALGISGDFDDHNARFPSVNALAQALARANPNLNQGEAGEYAHEITETNDRGMFNSAWRALDRALRGVPRAYWRLNEEGK